MHPLWPQCKLLSDKILTRRFDGLLAKDVLILSQMGDIQVGLRGVLQLGDNEIPILDVSRDIFAGHRGTVRSGNYRRKQFYFISNNSRSNAPGTTENTSGGV
ncbi:hypothetical protein TNCV_371931 [Trichonephila clavipes]|nr:hypothetical protein TNCV_371931 [Trichonephila clavipes]